MVIMMLGFIFIKLDQGVQWKIVIRNLHLLEDDHRPAEVPDGDHDVNDVNVNVNVNVLSHVVSKKM